MEISSRSEFCLILSGKKFFVKNKAESYDKITAKRLFYKPKCLFQFLIFLSLIYQSEYFFDAVYKEESTVKFRRGNIERDLKITKLALVLIPIKLLRFSKTLICQ